MDPLEIVRATRLDGLGGAERRAAVRAFARLEAELTAARELADAARETIRLGFLVPGSLMLTLGSYDRARGTDD